MALGVIDDGYPAGPRDESVTFSASGNDSRTNGDDYNTFRKQGHGGVARAGQEMHHLHQSASNVLHGHSRDRGDYYSRHAHDNTQASTTVEYSSNNGQNNTGTGIGVGPTIKNPPAGLEVKCGPLLNYRRMSEENSSTPTWHGSVLIVTTIGQVPPRLRLHCVGPVGSAQAQEHNGYHEQNSDSRNPNPEGLRTFTAVKLYADPRCEFWRFSIDLPLQGFQSQWEYHIPGLKHLILRDSEAAATKVFVVPSASQSMRIMFHSCNGFSLGTDEDAWSGCALWNDVLRKHKEMPFHVMIGGGDQIYNDGVKAKGPLKKWAELGNPKKRRDHDFDEQLRAECDDYYLNNYLRWYSTEPFASANGIIPQVNIWDDHDIIDGFGSYTDHFMKCAVFRGIGGVSYKYYLLFQQHVPPPPSTFTTSSKSTWHGPSGVSDTSAADPVQLRDTYVMHEPRADGSYLFGGKPGPYVEERSRSIYCRLGRRIAFLGVDARTERTRHQVNYPQTYDMLFEYAAQRIREAQGQIKHLVLLLGVPIAYPRMVWLENIFTSPIIGPIRFLSRRFGLAGGFFNQFDGQVELLDDLDDHYACRAHKAERTDLVQRLQAFSKAHSVRVTILGGDVHLAAYGRFYSNPKLRIPAHLDHRYMPNVISSAITNHPPPAAVANLLARRNKIHHFDGDTDETLLNIWDEDPGAARGMDKITKDFNRCTMPSRNYAILTESHDPHTTDAESGRVGNVDGQAANDRTANGHTTNGHTTNGQIVNGHTTNGDIANGHIANSNADVSVDESMQYKGGRLAHHTLSEKHGSPREAISDGELGCGTMHPAADSTKPSGLGGRYGLDVCYRIEIDHGDREGKTQGYGVTIPSLDLM